MLANSIPAPSKHFYSPQTGGKKNFLPVQQQKWTWSHSPTFPELPPPASFQRKRLCFTRANEPKRGERREGGRFAIPFSAILLQRGPFSLYSFLSLETDCSVPRVYQDRPKTPLSRTLSKKMMQFLHFYACQTACAKMWEGRIPGIAEMSGNVNFRLSAFFLQSPSRRNLSVLVISREAFFADMDRPNIWVCV